MPAYPVPAQLAHNVVNVWSDAGAAWLSQLSGLISACERHWGLVAMAPLDGVSYNYVAPAVRADGTEVVLKIGFPNPELTSEIDALWEFDGRGSVGLLDVDRERGALLLERLKPGTPLSDIADDAEATQIAAQVMRQLWRPGEDNSVFRSVGQWAEGLDRMRHHFEGGTGPLPRMLVEKAEGLFAELLPSMSEPVLLHGDLHHANILRAERQPWLAIDPKGIVGEPEYELGALLRNIAPRLLERPRPSEVVAQRVEILCDALGFERSRLAGWGLAQAVLAAWWCIEDHTGGWQRFVRSAELILEAMH
jgi:streptomycin 6-kinase